jgi:hypothetical protein
LVEKDLNLMEVVFESKKWENTSKLTV